MKAYILTTGIAFALLAAAHAARLAVEGLHLLGEPVFMLTTIGSIGIFVWSLILLKGFSRSSGAA